MSLYKHAKSKFWHYDFQFQGIRYHGSTCCASKRDAARFEAEIRRTAALGICKKPTITLLSACDSWWEAKGQYLRSEKTVKYQLVNLVEGLGQSSTLQDQTLARIDAYIARRRASVANASVNREIGLLRQVVNWNAARGFEVAELAWKEVRLKESAVVTRVLSPREEVRLFDKLPESLKALVEFALLSGQRKSEVVMLRWKDVDRDNARATIWAKGQKPHSFPLTPRMLAIIDAQPEICSQVFTYVAERSAPQRADRPKRVKGQRYPFSRQGWDRKWRRALAEAGIEDYRFHDNRHTAATRTGRIEIAFTLLGHSDIRTTKRYFHTAEDEVRNAMIAAESRNSPEPLAQKAKKPRKTANVR